MKSGELIKRAFWNALGVVAYLLWLAWLMHNIGIWMQTEPQANGVLGPVLFLLLFIISACVTGALVLLKPATLYLEGAKKEALHLFASTIGFLIVLAILTGFLVGIVY